MDTKKLGDPQDTDLSIEAFRKVFDTLSDAEKIAVNFTVDTKVMAAAAVHAALTASLVGNLIFDCVGGRSRDQHGRVPGESMGTRRSALTMARETLGQTHNRLPQGYYEEARVLAECLPNGGKEYFVCQAAKAPYLLRRTRS